MRAQLFALLAIALLGLVAFIGGTGRGAAQEATGPAVGGYLANTDMPGNDYRSFKMWEGNAAACQAVCNRDRECGAWTMVNAGVQGPRPICYLKRRGSTQERRTCCTSGFAGGTLEGGVDRPGSDIDDIVMPAGSNPTDCFNRCRADGRCRAFTYVGPRASGSQPICYLKGQVPDPVPGTGTTSGVVG